MKGPGNKSIENDGHRRIGDNSPCHRLPLIILEYVN